MATAALELPEMQGLIASGYGGQPFARYLVLRVADPGAARRTIGRLLPAVTFFGDREGTARLNLALAFTGLGRLGCDDATLDGFSREFREGMVTPHRQRVLGDLAGGPGDPRGWRWGGARDRGAEALLMVFEQTPAKLRARLDALRPELGGFQVMADLPTTPLRDGREHFGFRDGLSQPVIRELDRPAPGRDRLAAGEFVLGYADESGVPEPAPAFARNGSYLVFRQLVQDVAGFWGWLRDLRGDEEDRVALASKMVGRWPDGTPLTVSPEPPAAPDPTNDFAFAKDDGDGRRCPFGAHIRRANPRDALFDDPGKSQKIVNRHRLLRRGRAFGLPLPPAAYPPGCVVEAAPGADGPSDERGLYFACLNASLSRQFEFVQQTWLHNPKFHGLSSDANPVSGQVCWSGPHAPAVFSAPGPLVRERVPVPRPFVHAVGGEYFFLPGRNALQRLAGGT